MVTNKINTKEYANEFKNYSKNNLMTGGLNSFKKQMKWLFYVRISILTFTKMYEIYYYQIFITYFLYRCQCKKFAEVTLDEFSKGMSSFKVTTIKDLKSK